MLQFSDFGLDAGDNDTVVSEFCCGGRFGAFEAFEVKREREFGCFGVCVNCDHFCPPVFV